MLTTFAREQVCHSFYTRLGRKKTAVFFFSTSSAGAALVGIFQYLDFGSKLLETVLHVQEIEETEIKYPTKGAY